MAENTRSKSNKRSSQKTQFENYTNNLSDKEMVAETYKAKEKASSLSQATKKLKKAEASSSLSSPNNNDNNMIIDDKNEMEHPISSEPNVSSRDASTNVSQTPITNSQDAMDTDLPENNSDKGITQGSADTQITSDTNNDVNSHNLEIFKEYNSRSDSQYILFFMRDQFDKEKSNNEILNDLKNAFLMEKDVIEYKINKKATIEFYTILIGTEETFNKIKDKPVPLLNNTAPKIYSRDAIDNLINHDINNLRARSVNLLNVPINYDINLLIKHIANFTSSAIDITLTFNKPNAVEYLLSQHKWGILIENFLIRIVPIDEQQHNFKNRTTPTETDYTIIPHNKERKYRKKFLKRQNSYTLNDNVKLSYDQIKPLMFSQRNRPNPHGRHNTRPPPNQGYQTKAPNNSTFTPRDKRHNRGPASRSTFIPDNDMNNWDVNPNNANANKPTIKGKQRASDNSNNDELLNRIVHLETIIKDLSSEIMGLKITDKQHKKDIIFLKEQETRHANNMEKLNQHLTTINENMAKQAATISGVPKIVTFLENLEQNGFFSQFNDNNQAYGSNNYSYPPHDEFVTEEHLQEEYNDSQSGYESSSTVETHNVFLDTDYTPSRPTGGYPTITSSISNKFDNIDDSSHNSGVPDCFDWIHDIKQFTFASHNIQGGSKKK
ncbi:hypothetical protein GLOIN_2v1768599 [Rhizophagus irregularis DAOM 181602=DAOM 197198]|uniref:Uncharacterized protein n=1 Tax=Rhizophagus irregularis (strain DAOM 181602 / DAOM 197198 / MUCL 43194) TaxID=747089 RepID=A0A2P4QGC7_RHIID|nr:hypothetical protein GLOIN_2v1768599 [Rhizophagus irregularis DAOM 181602=DAOM 197198]POG76695.1 hypothetical protein GLOIN_2v1768599 [Rhizophagus irregularis DAOM 181602=DAOM 197198]|eukprot:XP_025183561.1 hypothetical protein GLOIN_2v1768599 [Rhizophagus irregularis DAOM 181602=DAOM 197198]